MTKFLPYLLALSLLPLPTLADNEDSLQRPITLALNDWASQRVLSRVVGKLFEQMGYQVKFQQIKVDDQWGAFRLGVVDVQVELWQGAKVKNFAELAKRNKIIDAGTHIATAREEWWYPSYVKPLCPGLPNWRALQRCAHLFSQSGRSGKGLYYTGPWNAHEGERIRAFDLNFTIVRLEDDHALWQKLREALSERRPIMLLNWTPNWTDIRVKGEFRGIPRLHR